MNFEFEAKERGMSAIGQCLERATPLGEEPRGWSRPTHASAARATEAGCTDNGAMPQGPPNLPQFEPFQNPDDRRDRYRPEAVARRGPAGQQGRRRREAAVRRQAVRRQAVTFCRWTQDRGGTLARAAGLLNVKSRTLRHWSSSEKLHPWPANCLGRPPMRAPREQRMAVLDCLRQGPWVGLADLQTRFPALARAELDDLRRRYCCVLRQRYHETLQVLHWQTPGRVWAMDFAEPAELGGTECLPPVDGLDAYLLAVRDLASGYVLAWLPLPDMTASTLLPVLQQLFARQGPPLVLKMDNGSAFRADETKAFLTQFGVIPLFSPPHWPQYNGAIEAGIGSLKMRTDRHAAWRARSDAWTSDDLAAALFEANNLANYHGCKPIEAWRTRMPITPHEREALHIDVEEQRLRVRAEEGVQVEATPDHWRNSALDRLAIPRALVEHGHLLFRRRRIPLTLNKKKVTRLM
jgi:transposase InsO family protein